MKFKKEIFVADVERWMKNNKAALEGPESDGINYLCYKAKLVNDWPTAAYAYGMLGESGIELDDRCLWLPVDTSGGLVFNLKDYGDPESLRKLPIIMRWLLLVPAEIPDCAEDGATFSGRYDDNCFEGHTPAEYEAFKYYGSANFGDVCFHGVEHFCSKSKTLTLAEVSQLHDDVAKSQVLTAWINRDDSFTEGWEI